jgi:predicted amidohydrolase YtcJ
VTGRTDDERRTLLRGGRIWVGDPPAPRAAWLLVEGARIASFGEEEVPARAGADGELEIVELDGGQVLPGITDPHTHLAVAALSPVSGSGRDWRHRDDAISAVAQAVRHTPVDRWVVFLGVSHREWDEPRRPTSDELDAVSGEHPVLLADETIHEGVLNSAGMRASGVAWLTDGHGDVDRGRRGVPTGLVWERAFGRAMVLAIRSLLAADEGDRFRAELDRLARRCLDLGIVRIHEAAVPPAIAQELERWRERTALRISWSLTPPEWYDAPSALAELHALPSGDGPTWLKLFADGGHRCAIRLSLRDGLRSTAVTLRRALRSRSLLPLEAFSERRTSLRGRELAATAELRYRDDQLAELLRACRDSGVIPRIHAIGGLAAAQAARAAGNAGLERWSLEHALLLGEGDVDTIAASADIVSIQPRLLPDYADAIRDSGAAAALEVMPARSLRQAGVTLALSSDDPSGPVDPLDYLRIAIHRRLPDGTVWDGDEVLSREEVVASATRDAAAGAGADAPGTITEGAPADLVAFDGDPFVHGTRVLGTWVAGERVAAPG